jgi:hypothetical protein
VVGGLKSDVSEAHLLAGHLIQHASTLKIERLNPLDVKIQNLPITPPGEADFVIAANCSGDIEADPLRLLQPAFPIETLRAFDGGLHGGLRFGPGKKTDDVVIDWKKTSQFISWPVRINAPADYEVSVNYDAEAESAGNVFTVTFTQPDEAKSDAAGESLTGVVKPGKQQTQSLGRIHCGAGSYIEIVVTARQIKGGELFRLRRLELHPVTK